MNLKEKIEYLKTNFPDRWEEELLEMRSSSILDAYRDNPKKFNKELEYRTVKSLTKLINED